VYAQYTGDTRWNQVADKCYQIVEEVKKYNNGTGLVPDWCTASGTPASVRVTTTNMMLHVTAGELPWTIHGLVTREQRQTAIC